MVLLRIFSKGHCVNKKWGEILFKNEKMPQNFNKNIPINSDSDIDFNIRGYIKMDIILQSEEDKINVFILIF